MGRADWIWPSTKAISWRNKALSSQNNPEQSVDTAVRAVPCRLNSRRAHPKRGRRQPPGSQSSSMRTWRDSAPKAASSDPAASPSAPPHQSPRSCTAGPDLKKRAPLPTHRRRGQFSALMHHWGFCKIFLSPEAQAC